MAFSVLTTGCCGVLELKDISTKKTPEDIIKDSFPHIKAHTDGWYHKKPFIMFTSVVNRVVGDHASYRTDDYGKALADYIEAQGLGEVVRTIPEKKNWTQNLIKVWMWIPNYEALSKLTFPEATTLGATISEVIASSGPPPIQRTSMRDPFGDLFR